MASFLAWNGKEEAHKVYESLLGDNYGKEGLQLIETLQPPAFKQTKESWYNLLLLGDNKLIMAVILKKFARKLKLIYIDPPFATGGEFNYKIQIGDGDESKKSHKWVRKQAYNDSWKNGLESYLSFMYERLLFAKDLLSDDGSIYIHLDWHAGHYVKLMMDEIFGASNFRNEIIWAYPAASAHTKKYYVRSFDIILYYTKSANYEFNDDPNIYMEYSDRVKNALNKDEKGIFYYRGGSHDGKKLAQKVYLKKRGVFPRDVWTDIPYVRANTLEYQGFSTQKPERLLKRIILASTSENDLVADFFCGSGTTLAVAEKLKRRWIGCDLSQNSLHMVKKRLLDISNTNHIFEWKNAYGLRANPFKIMRLSSDIKFLSLIEQFLFLDKDKCEIDLHSIERPRLVLISHVNENKVRVEIKDYIVPYENLVLPEIRNNIRKFSDWIDYWSVDFNHDEQQEFCLDWVSFRTPKKRTLKMISKTQTYDKPGSQLIKIHVVDICGIETRQELVIKIKQSLH
ncbi:MAG: site-specific DNA-methyltransferase [Candidatus Lokiarchaeota archaeon]|nr:site-specific DNA-methyltransferase [Candidatus Lokiarchaeota archaeon]